MDKEEHEESREKRGREKFRSERESDSRPNRDEEDYSAKRSRRDDWSNERRDRYGDRYETNLRSYLIDDRFGRDRRYRDRERNSDSYGLFLFAWLFLLIFVVDRRRGYRDDRGSSFSNCGLV